MDNYCASLHHGLEIRNDTNEVRLSPCCAYSEPYVYHPPGEVHFEELFKQARIDNINGIVPSGCENCFLRPLPRITDGLGGIRIIEVALGSICDSACLICAPGISSFWRRYDDQYDKRFKINSDIESLKSVLLNFDLKDLKEIKMLGGEPFLSGKNNIELLKLLDEVSRADQIKVIYNTNGLTLPTDDIIEELKKFKEVVIIFSIDDINGAYEYQRFPGNWNVLQDNIKMFVDRLGTNTTFNVQCTMSILNVHSTINSWFRNMPNLTELDKHNAGGVLSLDNISMKHFMWLEENHPHALEYVNKPTNDSSNRSKHDIMDFILVQDRKRNMDITTWFPEFLSFYKS